MLARDQAFDGILMDCQMPVMDGYTATRAIRMSPDFGHLPIVAMTANAMAGDKERVREAGMNDHVAKPLNVHDMFETLAQWIAPSAGPFDDEFEAAIPGEAEPAAPPLPEFTSIDTAAGLSIVRGNRALYRKLLHKFRIANESFGAQMERARSADDIDAAMRCAHTLRGTAGSIGALGVQGRRDAARAGLRAPRGRQGTRPSGAGHAGRTAAGAGRTRGRRQCRGRRDGAVRRARIGPQAASVSIAAP